MGRVLTNTRSGKQKRAVSDCVVTLGGKNGQKRAGIVFDAVKKTGQRRLVACGWGGLKASDLPENIFMLDAVPHDWLFPQVSAVVHHGGAGTTAAGLRAGKPTAVCPFLGDQPFWGRIIEQLGVGPKPVPRSRLTVDHIVSAIRTVTSNTEMQR